MNSRVIGGIILTAPFFILALVLFLAVIESKLDEVKERKR